MNSNELIANNLDLIDLMGRTELIKWAFLQGEISGLRDANETITNTCSKQITEQAE
jgi:hypothetical protein